MQLLIAFAFSVVVAGTAVGATAFECARSETRIKNAYAQISGQAGCEGYVEEEISASYLEVMSLFRKGADVFSVRPLQFFASRSAARFVVRPLFTTISYRADLPNDPSGATWDPQQMLRLTGLRIEDLGFLALSPASNERRLSVVPVAIGTSDAGGASVAVIRTSVNTKEVHWRMLPARPKRDEKWRLAATSVDKWGLVEIELARATGTEGPFVVQVRARDDAGDLLPVLEFLVLDL
jgi:hypothetical protein